MPHEGTEHRKLAAIMFTDMVGYSALAQRNEALALELVMQQQQFLRPIFPKYQGREVKSTGDGFLAEFPSALAATLCAIEIQKILAAHNASVPQDRGLQVRIGIHLGDVVYRDADIYGDGVNIAARIEPLAEAGGICVSRAVADQVANKMETPLVALRQPELKNIRTAIEVFRVVLPWEQPQASPRPRVQLHRDPITPRRRLWLGTAGLGAALVLALVLFVAFKSLSPNVPNEMSQRGASSKTALPEFPRSIAVLPFANLSPDKADEYLAEGITEHLTTALSQVKDIRVPSRNSAAAFKDSTEDLRKIGEQLRVDAVLRGSVQKVGDKLHITSQLLNVSDDTHLWAKSYDGQVADVFAMQSEIGQRVAEALKGRLLEGEKHQLLKRPTENLEAYRLYHIGRFHWGQETPKGLIASIEYFHQALALDTNYAPAYAGLAGTYHLGGGRGFFPLKENVLKAKEAVLKALELDPELSDAHRELGAIKFLYDWDWAAAGRALQKAISLNPNDVEAVSLFSGYLMATGRIDESLVQARRALILDPLSARYLTLFAGRLYHARLYDDSLVQATKAVEMNASYPGGHLARGYALLGKQKVQEAIRHFEEAKRLVERPATVGPLGYAYALAGRVVDARALMESLKQPSQLERGSAYFVALILLGLREDQEAFTWLQKAKEDRSAYLVSLSVDPVFDGVRADPRFKAILQDLGLNLPVNPGGSQ